MMISPLDSLETKPSSRARMPLHRTMTLDAKIPNSSFGRLDINDNNREEEEKPAAIHKPKKNVTFTDQSSWECHQLDPFMDSESQLKEFWVLPDELKEIKMQGFMDCKEARRSGLAALLTEIYGTGSPRENQDRLNYWCRMASPCRGLERFANEELSKRRAIYRKRAIVSVLEAQQQLKNEKDIDTANVLRRLSEAYTEKARNFAVSLAIADYHAIHAVKAPPPPPRSPKKEEVKTVAEQQQKQPRTARKSRTERMKERAAAAEQKTDQASQQQQQQQSPDGEIFRRNNTTMTAVVGLKQ